MARQIAGIDHAIVGVRDLEQARASYQRLGFQADAARPPRRLGHGQLLRDVRGRLPRAAGHRRSGQFTNELDRFLAEREGLLALALRSTDARATHAAWQAAGLAPAEVAALGRRLEPDTELRFENVMLAPEATGGVRAVRLRAADARGDAPAGAGCATPTAPRAIASVTVAVDDPAAFYEPMAQVFGSICLTETDDTLAVHTGRGVLLFATPDDLDMLHPGARARDRDRRRADAGGAQPHGARSGGDRRLARPSRRRLPARQRRHDRRAARAHPRRDAGVRRGRPRARSGPALAPGSSGAASAALTLRRCLPGLCGAHYHGRPGRQGERRRGRSWRRARAERFLSRDVARAGRALRRCSCSRLCLAGGGVKLRAQNAPLPLARAASA